MLCFHQCEAEQSILSPIKQETTVQAKQHPWKSMFVCVVVVVVERGEGIQIRDWKFVVHYENFFKQCNSQYRFLCSISKSIDLVQKNLLIIGKKS